tara:strand:- start:6485 stop:6793 length:309 start_codon:yes stop_codon:yes gene_type:complete
MYKRSAIPRNKQNINLIYIRAAIEARTGITLSLSAVRKYLVEENLITPRQARNNSREFEGYKEFYNDDIFDRYTYPEYTSSEVPDDVQGLLNENFNIGDKVE